eukprot:7490949-Lingulodinium_polyedra.AAC.1
MAAGSDIEPSTYAQSELRAASDSTQLITGTKCSCTHQPIATDSPVHTLLWISSFEFRTR